ncbi:Hypothetical protein NTJ_11512 [Nesidiocoris tenuis]|uniref:DNA repair protein XRCC4 n=1 Tax=Nesidiocoris tenuis TaxID=355587 RepID=A0ABN7B2Q3_9HEMI|nr:Hypothetical protein NTJ_11512 [Nesidiocoris tenuis]
MGDPLTIVTISDHETHKPLKLQGQWSERQVRFLLNDGVSSWTCFYNLDTDLDESRMSLLNLDEEQYFQNLKSALGTRTKESEFRYTFSNDRLTWAKEVPSMGKDFVVEYGQLEMTRVTESGELVKSLLDSYGKVLEELSASVERYKRLEQDYNDINSAFEDTCRLKAEMETNLYTKFALLLNEKKEYVRRVTGNEPSEDFGPKPSPEKISHSPTKTRTESLADFATRIRKNDNSDEERPAKKAMLDPAPGTSTDSFQEMEF